MVRCVKRSLNLFLPLFNQLRQVTEINGLSFVETEGQRRFFLHTASTLLHGLEKKCHLWTDTVYTHAANTTTDSAEIC